jgi:Phage integrase, N-terminal SAM-like domain
MSESSNTSRALRLDVGCCYPRRKKWPETQLAERTYRAERGPPERCDLRSRMASDPTAGVSAESFCRSASHKSKRSAFASSGCKLSTDLTTRCWFKPVMTVLRFVDTVWRDYLDQQGVKPSTIYSYDSMLQNLVLPSFGQKTVDQITPVRLSLLFKAAREKKYSPKTLLNLYSLLKVIFEVTRELDLIEASPKRPKLHRPNHERKEKPSYTPDQLRGWGYGLGSCWPYAGRTSKVKLWRFVGASGGGSCRRRQRRGRVRRGYLCRTNQLNCSQDTASSRNGAVISNSFSADRRPST